MKKKDKGALLQTSADEQQSSSTSTAEEQEQEEDEDEDEGREAGARRRRSGKLSQIGTVSVNVEGLFDDTDGGVA